MLILHYPTKKNLIANIGKKLKYREAFNSREDYCHNGELIGCNRPSAVRPIHIFVAKIVMKDGFIWGVK